jgi:hypothetical protein
MLLSRYQHFRCVAWNTACDTKDSTLYASRNFFGMWFVLYVAHLRSTLHNGYIWFDSFAEDGAVPCDIECHHQLGIQNWVLVSVIVEYTLNMDFNCKELCCTVCSN